MDRLREGMMRVSAVIQKKNERSAKKRVSLEEMIK